jgi:hypothetical protein
MMKVDQLLWDTGA